MAYQHYLKDKKIEVWDFETKNVLGVEKKTYFRALDEKLWAYYRQTGGNVTIEGSALKYYDTSERVIFVVNRRSDFLPKTRHVITYNGKIYEIKNVDDYEGYLHDLKITAELATYQDLTYWPGIEL